MNNSSNQTTATINQISILRLVIIYICCCVGLVFNTTVYVIIWNRKYLCQSLNLLIANLALADIGNCLTSIYSSILVSLALYNPLIFTRLPGFYYNNFCKSVNFFAIISACNAMTTLAMISIERFRGIVYPLKLHFSQRQTKLMIAFTWIYSTAVAVLFVCFSSYEKNEILECSAILSSQITAIHSIFTFISSIMCCILPLIVITTCYTGIVIKICRKSPPMDDSEYKNKVMKTIRKRNRCISSHGLQR